MEADRKPSGLLMAEQALQPEQVYAKIAELVRFLAPTACNLRIRYDLPDGAKSVLAIPEVAESKDAAGLTTTQRDILRVLKDSKVPLNAKQIAEKCGNRTYKGYFGEKLRELVSDGVCFKSGGLVTDNPEKFKATGNQG